MKPLLPVNSANYGQYPNFYDKETVIVFPKSLELVNAQWKKERQ